MGFIDHDDVVILKKRICTRFLKQDPVGHDLHDGVIVRFVVKPNGIAHLLTQFHAHFFGDSPCDTYGRNTAWLRDTNTVLDKVVTK